jgi:hypothetical protein
MRLSSYNNTTAAVEPGVRSMTGTVIGEMPAIPGHGWRAIVAQLATPLGPPAPGTTEPARNSVRFGLHR